MLFLKDFRRYVTCFIIGSQEYTLSDLEIIRFRPVEILQLEEPCLTD